VALRWYAQGIQERSGVSVTVNIPDDLGRFGREMELMLFRLVQECLTNIHRHSGSKTAEISVWCENEHVCLDVEDQGKGIPTDKLTTIRSEGGGVGIRGMRERMRRFQGTMDVKSSDSGTLIAFRFPIQHSAAPDDDSTQMLQVSA
jgi:signal transduction histidine kinase